GLARHPAQSRGINPAPYHPTNESLLPACPVVRHESCEAGRNRLSWQRISGILHKFNAKLVHTA
ncbi:MAG: hypothetical protein ACKO51_12835, partial [Alphaproteobacteria bacterium]